MRLTQRRLLKRLSALALPSIRRPEQIFIASIHWNTERILQSWNEALGGLVKELGTENVFVAVHENGSWDGTKAALKELDAQLGANNVERNISVSNTTHLDEILADHGSGWVETSRGIRELRRIPYLFRLRNQALELLQQLAQKGTTFDKVLFLNDVVFSPSDALQLLGTNNGEYAAACAMDFKTPPQFYDTFALRDAEGSEILMQTWPYFRARKSRHALLAKRPTPVASCWSGMVAMAAQPFLSSPPLRFRGVSDSVAASHVEGSECCLIHVDNTEKQVYVNPNVLVGYSSESYDAIHSMSMILSPWQMFQALCENRIRRCVTSSWHARRKIQRRLRGWNTTQLELGDAG
ncbi:hypothetical protein EK21DRAFT_105211 [Setomelanomma holmii]|uniref:Polysaccharide export protein n=1 Tax=Setomelanomma holmii TaxID=210430 RepID=A0A9P4GY35_9PLEO|nr:hypothetical protein EK21DRAFT_105211 [Setomelanomma holmii]